MIASYFEWQLYIRKCDMFRFVWIVVCFRRLPWAWQDPPVMRSFCCLTASPPSPPPSHGTRYTGTQYKVQRKVWKLLQPATSRDIPIVSHLCIKLASRLTAPLSFTQSVRLLVGQKKLEEAEFLLSFINCFLCKSNTHPYNPWSKLCPPLSGKIVNFLFASSSVRG